VVCASVESILNERYPVFGVSAEESDTAGSWFQIQTIRGKIETVRADNFRKTQSEKRSD
jgi:hypothetical protein